MAGSILVYLSFECWALIMQVNKGLATGQALTRQHAERITTKTVGEEKILKEKNRNPRVSTFSPGTFFPGIQIFCTFRMRLTSTLFIFLLRHCTLTSPEGHPRIESRSFTLKALLLYPPHAKVIRSQERGVSYIAIIIPVKADLLGF